MLMTIGVVFAALVIALLAYAGTKPDTFQVSRATIMKAPPDKIFPYFNDLRKNLEWSPFERKDPNMNRAFSGAELGPGAIYEFAGNNQVGAGRITITESVAGAMVVMTLEMFKPMAASNVVTYTLSPRGERTEVIWAMEGKMPYLGKVMHAIFNFDKMVGNDFAKGLSNLKAIVETVETKA